MTKIRLAILGLCALSLGGCAFPSRSERIADRMTRAVIAGDMRPVMDLFDPKTEGELTLVRVAELSDELRRQGAYAGLSQTRARWCPAGFECFDVHFEVRPYRELMQLGPDGKVQYWWIRRTPARS